METLGVIDHSFIEFMVKSDVFAVDQVTHFLHNTFCTNSKLTQIFLHVN